MKLNPAAGAVATLRATASAILLLALAGNATAIAAATATAPPPAPARSAVQTPAATALPDYATWRAACRRLPTNRQLGGRLAPRELLPLRSSAAFDAALGPFLDQYRTGALARADAWLDGPPPATFLDLDAAYGLRAGSPFLPFAQRYEAPPGTRLFIHGDLHGDIHSLLAFLDALNRDRHLDGFRVAKPEVRLVFLGDYTDRGMHGVEVLYTLLRLKLASPDQVLLVRGNHEDLTLVTRYGFLAEVAGKYGRDFNIPRVVRLYEFLPSVLYLTSGTNVVQCNHGGLEPGYDPGRLLAAPAPASFQLLGRLQQRRLLASNAAWVTGLPQSQREALEGNLADFVPQTPTSPTVLGFLWNDFTVAKGEPQFAIDPGRAFVYGDEAAHGLLAQAGGSNHRVRALFRAHQHAPTLNPLMRRLVASRGIFRHWQSGDSINRLEAEPSVLLGTLEVTPERPVPDGSVWTFNVSPDSIYGAGCGFSFDTAGELVMEAKWEDWRLRVINIAVPEIR